MFKNNNGSAMHVTASLLNFHPGSRVDFFNNSGFSGGAICLIGMSAIKVSDDNFFRFINNTALSRGGAMYYFSIDNHNYVSSRQCFIDYTGSKNITERNVAFLFENNTVLHDKNQPGQAIFVSSLLPCRKRCKHAELFSCIGHFTLNNTEPNISPVATKGSRFYRNSTSLLPLMAVPGKKTFLPFEFRDDLNQTIRARCSISDSVYKDSIFSYSTKFSYVFYGSPGETTMVSIETIGFREVQYSVPVLIEECPPGYVIDNSQARPTCICSSDTNNKLYKGIDKCNHSEFRAYIRRGYWAGYHQGDNETEDSLLTGHCPFCLYKQQRTLLPDKASRLLLDKVCVGKRTGILCGKCTKNHAILFHNHNYVCYSSKTSCKYGPLLYIISELIPVTVLFIVVLVFNVSFTSGAVNGFILFAQIIVDMHLDADNLIRIPTTTNNFFTGMKLIYQTVNLDFFSIEPLSFCLWQGASLLDILVMKYVTIVYSFVLVFTTILILRICASRNCLFCKRTRGKQVAIVKGSIIHGLTSFLVMCYAQCAHVSVLILTAGNIYKRSDFGDVPFRSVVLYSGEVGYFDGSHLPYALPALFFLVCIVLAPPMLLIIYPLCYKLLNFFRIKEDRVTSLCKLLPLEKLKPLFDSFQSCFKDEHRYFAGLYFFYRLAIPVTFALSQTIWFYVYVELVLIFMLALHSLCQPYRHQWHNRLDSFLFFILAVINGITLSNYHNSTFSNIYQHRIDSGSSAQAFLLVLPLFYIVSYVVGKLSIRIFRYSKRKIDNRSDTRSLDVSLLDRRHLDESSDNFVTSYKLDEYRSE